MGNKGSATTTTSTQAPQYLQNAYQGVVGQAQTAAATPYVPYSGELVAGVNPEETAGIGGINQFADAAQPYLNQAAGYANSAAAPVSQQQIQSYENPYTSQVLGSTEQQMALLNAQQNQNVVGNAVSSGAWGGDRASVAQSELAGQQSAAEAPVLAGIASQGYNTGLSTALTEQQQEAQAAYSLGNIGQGVQSAGLTGAGAQIQGGQLQQGTQQALDTAQMQQYYTAMGYPFQTASWLAGIEGGVGGVAGGTSSTTAPPPNPLNAIIGGASTVAGAYLGAARGGGIPRFDAGGATPYSGGIGFIPAPPQGRGGMMNPSTMLMYGSHPGQVQQPVPGFSSLGAGIGKRLGSSSGIDTSGAGSGFPQEGSADANSLTTVVSPDAWSAGGFDLATGGGVGPESAGQGFAGDGGVDDPDSPYNTVGLAAVPQPNVGYSGTDMPAGFSMNADTLGLTGTGHDPGSDGTQTAGTVPVRSPGIGAASAYTPSPFAPSGLNPNGGVGSSAPSGGYSGPSYSDESSRPQDTRTLGQKLSLPLMQAGFAMMASRSPFVGEAIGQGGLAGIGGYLAQEKEKRSSEETQQDIGLKAKQLSDLADQHRQTLAQQEKQHSDTLNLENRKETFTENQPRVVPMGANLVSPQGPNAGKVIASNSASILNPNAVEIGARRLANGDTTALTGLPQGTAGAAARAALVNRAADIRINEMGDKPEDAAAFVTAATQQVHAAGIGQGAEARTAGTREANLNLILATTNSAIPAALEASKAVARTGWVPINQIIQKGEVIASDPDLKSFGMANLQLAEGWARAMNPTGVMRESDRDKALSFLSTADSQPTYERAVKQLQTQIQRERDAVHSQRPATPGAPAPSEAPQAGGTTAAPAIPPPDQREVGKTYQTPKGPATWTNRGTWQQATP